MIRRILIFTAAALASLALSLFLALVLEWPMFVVYLVGMTPMIAVATSVGPNDRDRRDGRR